MARIYPVTKSELQPSVQLAFKNHVKEYNARITNMKAVLGHSLLSLEVYMRWYPLYEQVEKILGKHLAYLYAYSISRSYGCVLCSGFCRKIIIANEKLENLVLTPSQKDITNFGSNIAKYQGKVRDHVYNRIEKRYTKTEIVILIAFAGQMIATNVFNNVIKTDNDEYIVGNSLLN